MKKAKHSPSWWCLILSLITGASSALCYVLFTKDVCASDLCISMCVFNFIGCLILMAFHIKLGTDELTLKPEDEEELSRFLADVYILSWKHYQEYEKNITKALLTET